MHNNMLSVLVSSTVDMYEMMSCFITGSHIWIWKPITFPEMLLYDKQFENDSDWNDNYKILLYFHKDVKYFTKLNVAIFKDLGEGVVIVKLPNI